jgi:hypothetical protein
VAGKTVQVLGLSFLGKNTTRVNPKRIEKCESGRKFYLKITTALEIPKPITN